MRKEIRKEKLTNIVGKKKRKNRKKGKEKIQRTKRKNRKEIIKERKRKMKTERKKGGKKKVFYQYCVVLMNCLFQQI